MASTTKKVTISDIPPSPHKWQGKPFVYKRLRDKWYALLLCLLGINYTTFRGRYLTITMYRPRLLDDTNKYFSVKPLEDCLKEWIERHTVKKPWGKSGLAWIRDDNPNELNTVVLQIKVKTGKEEKTEIVIQ